MTLPSTRWLGAILIALGLLACAREGVAAADPTAVTAPTPVPVELAPAQKLALSFLDALDAGEWEAASNMYTNPVKASPDALKTGWEQWEAEFGDAKDWRGAPVHGWSEGEFTAVFVPIESTDGHVVVVFGVEAGRIKQARIQVNEEKYGPYARLVGRAVIYSGGEVQRWYRVPRGKGIISELRNPDGRIRRMEVIKSPATGFLTMLRSAECPDSVCGQTGTLDGGVVAWKEPKASGGHFGRYMDAKVWVEGDEIVTFTTDPTPTPGFYDQYPQYRPVPYRFPLVQAPLTDEQRKEFLTMVAALEPTAEAQAMQVTAAAAARGQAQVDARAARQRSADRVRSFNNAMGVVSQALAGADAGGGYAEAQANLDATVANINAAAAAERQQQAIAAQQAQARAAEQQRQQLEENRRWVAQKEQGAAEYRAGETQAAAAREAQRPNQPQPQTQQQPQLGSTASPEVAAPAAARELRFVMSISLRNQPGDTVNPTCYSNIVSRPGPSGWGLPGFLPQGSAEKAREIVYALKSDFIARCRQSGREIVSDGSFNFHWNARQGDEEQLQGTRARYKEDVSVAF